MVDVLNNRRHQFIGVFMPMLITMTIGFQFTMYQCGGRRRTLDTSHGTTKWVMSLMSQQEHIHGLYMCTITEIMAITKKKDIGHEPWDYKMGDVIDVAAGTHPWTLHAHDHGDHGDHGEEEEHH